MRGRTNITPRTGPAVIGTDVTNKQVTGSAITVGDFVEFTGNTTVWEKLVGPINYQGEHFFDISDSIKGCVFINATSSQCKFVVFDNDGILQETTLNSVTFANESINNIDYDSVNNKIYILQYLGSSAWYTYNIYVFDISSLYSVTYDRTINFFVPSTYGSEREAVCVRNSYIYCIYRNLSAASPTVYVVKYNLDGSLFQDIYLNLEASSHSSSTKWFLLVTEDKFMCLPNADTNYYKFTFIFSSDSIYATKSSSSMEYMHRCGNGKLVSVNGYNFLVGMQPDNASYSGLTVFYYDNNNDIQVVQKAVINLQNFANLIDMIVERNGNDYKILCAVCGSGSGSTYDDINVRLYNFNSISGELVLLSQVTMSSSFVDYYWYKDCKLVNYSGVYNLFFAGCGNSSINNHLAKTKFIVSNDTIIQSESLDLVKKYQNRIDGVAKTSGNVGQTITVCIP